MHSTELILWSSPQPSDSQAVAATTLLVEVAGGREPATVVELAAVPATTLLWPSSRLSECIARIPAITGTTTARVSRAKARDRSRRPSHIQRPLTITLFP